MLAILALLATASGPRLEIELSGAGGFSIDRNGGASFIGLRAGADLFEHFSLGASILGWPGAEPRRSFCGSPCPGNGSFKAIAGLASLRLHTAGDLQAFAEGAIGIGHIISLSQDDLFENPPLRGSGGATYLLGAGARYFFLRQVALGLSLSWMRWSNLSQAGHYYGTMQVPDQSGLTTEFGLLLVSVSFAPWR